MLVFIYYESEAQSRPSLLSISNDSLKMGVFTVFDEIHRLGYCQLMVRNSISMGQEALNIWIGKHFHFFQILYNHTYPKAIVISIVDLQKTNNFAKFGGYCSKNAHVMPLRSLKWSRAWQAYFLNYHFQIWQKVEIL